MFLWKLFFLIHLTTKRRNNQRGAAKAGGGRMDEDKVKALHVHILDECKRQSFTVEEFQRLIDELKMELDVRRFTIEKELF